MSIGGEKHGRAGNIIEFLRPDDETAVTRLDRLKMMGVGRDGAHGMKVIFELKRFHEVTRRPEDRRQAVQLRALPF